MEHYEVVSVDDKRVGRIAGETKDFYIVEIGSLRKARHALPKQSASVDDDARSVRVQMSKEIICESPKVGSIDLNERAIRDYYGID